MDGVDEYRGDEQRWAVDTVLEGVRGAEVTTRLSARRLVESAWEFIAESCTGNGQTVPDIQLVIADVERELKELRSEGTN